MGRLLYSEWAPDPSLAPHVDCFWTVAVEPGGEPAPHHWVFPDGCWTVSVGIQPAWYIRLRRPAAKAFIAPSTPGELIVGMRLRPGLPPPELLSQARRRLRQGQRPEEILGVLSQLIRTCAREREARLDLMTAALRQNKGQISVAHVAAQLGIPNRQLERLSNLHLGLPPKTFGRITRLQSVLRRFIASPAAPLADISAEFGYADQTHMSRDFSELAQTTPLRYRRSLENVGFVLESDPN